jgi:DNA-binding MarR family transcriptional regulator
MVDLNRTTELNEALVLLHFGYRRIVDEPDRILAQRKLGRVHHRIMYFVGRNPGVSVGDLCATLDVTKQALHRPLQQLVAERLVEASSVAPGAHDGEADRRVKHLRLTKDGATLEARLSGLQRRLLAAAFEAAGPSGEAGWRRAMRALGARD